MNVKDLKKQLIILIPEVRSNLETGVFPVISKENAIFIENNPAIIFIILEVMLQGFSTKKSISKDDYHACSVLLTDALNGVRYALERGYPWAEEVIRDFQNAVVTEAFLPQLDRSIARIALSALQEAKIELTDEIKQAAQNDLDHFVIDEETAGDLNTIFDEIATTDIDNPFRIFAILNQQMSIMPMPAQNALICEMFTATSELIREVAILVLLHPNKVLRIGVLDYISKIVSKKNLSSVSLRRLIGIRNWLPEEERPKLDAMIKRARKLGVECAAWPKADITKITATEFDGSGVQGILIVSKDQQGHKLSGFIAKENSGIRDPWCSAENISTAQIGQISKEMLQATVAHEVKISYLNKLVTYYLWLGINNENCPPAVGFLELAEAVGISNWHAQPFNAQEELSYLLANIDTLLLDENLVNTSLQRSKHYLEKSGLTSSWFEDDIAVEKVIQKNKTSKHLKNIVLEQILEPRRQKWAQRFLWMALWAKETTDKKDTLWCDLAIMANEIYNGRPLKDIPIFTTISAETVAVME